MTSESESPRFSRLAPAVMAGFFYIVASIVTLELLQPSGTITTWNAGAVTTVAAFWGSNRVEEMLEESA